MRRRSYFLQQMLKPVVHRVAPNVLIRDLPLKQEFVLVCPLSGEQQRIYECFRKAY
eukprot:gene42569-58220_t